MAPLSVKVASLHHGPDTEVLSSVTLMARSENTGQVTSDAGL